MMFQLSHTPYIPYTEQDHCQLGRLSELFSHENETQTSNFIWGIFRMAHLTLDYIHYGIITPLQENFSHETKFIS